MSAASDAIREFHRAFDVVTPESAKYGIEYDTAVAQRKLLHEEEHVEVDDALAALGEMGALLKVNIDLGAAPRKLQAHLEALADELADTLVIAYGTADVLGIDLDRAFAIKMAANMAKLPACALCGGKGSNPNELLLGRPSVDCAACDGTGKGPPIKRESDGKVLRPPGWAKPDMSEAIK